nr:integrase, catalytic region, zinc finger, CCHC-type, peptidase aspartic, catalytic [Tanacetum cinerariifolium]
MGYGDYQIGNVTISRVYYVEGLGHNLLSVGQFCDSDLEVAFRQHTCFIRNLDRVDLLTARQGLVRGLPKLKFEKDHLCSAYAMGKSTRKTHKPKSEDTNQEKLYLLYMDLCGPMRKAEGPGRSKLPDLSFFYVFGALCYPINDSENLGYVDSTGLPSSTTVEQDAPSTSNSPTPTETQSSVIPQDVG